MDLTIYEAEMRFLSEITWVSKSVSKASDRGIIDADYPLFEEIMRKNGHAGNIIEAEFDKIKEMGFQKSVKHAQKFREKEREKPNERTAIDTMKHSKGNY